MKYIKKIYFVTFLLIFKSCNIFPKFFPIQCPPNASCIDGLSSTPSGFPYAAGSTRWSTEPGTSTLPKSPGSASSKLTISYMKY